MIHKYITLSVGLLFAQAALAQTTVTPTMANGKYYLNFADLSVEIDPAVGGRITSFKLGKKETQKAQNGKSDNDFGSSLQPAPQSLWNWPPPPNIDNQPYTAKIVGNEVVLIGEKDTDLNMSVEKRMHISTADTSLVINYTLKNVGAKAKSAACWEVTKVNSGGLIFYAKGLDNGTDLAKWTTTSKSGIVWYDHDSSKVKTNDGGTFKSDGVDGWYANVQPNGLVFVKKYTDTPVKMQAPGENENRVYINGNNTYLSFELQGPYGSIPGGGSTEWEVKWYVRALPSDIKAVSGNDKLVKYVKNIGVPLPNATENETSITSQASLSPQPVENEFHVVVDQSKFASVDVMIYDMFGKTVKEYTKVSGKVALQKQDLKAGMYTYTIMHEGQIIGKGKMQVQ